MSIEDSFTEKQIENWPRAIDRLTSTGATVSEYARHWNVTFYGGSPSDRDFVASYLDSEAGAQNCPGVFTAILQHHGPNSTGFTPTTMSNAIVAAMTRRHHDQPPNTR